MAGRAFRRDDRGVNEVVGYILTFALSAIILLISVQSFTVARQNSDSVVTAVELKAIANRVAARVVEAAQLSEEFPNATYSVTLNIPQDLNGHPYYVELDENRVLAVTDGGEAAAEATLFNINETSITVSGKVHSSNERIIVTFSATSGAPVISIR